MLSLLLTWAKTGDSFVIECSDDNFAIWFVDQCHSRGNSFDLSTMLHDQRTRFVDDEILSLQQCIDAINGFLSKIKWPLIDMPEEFKCQKSLNRLHKQWVMIHRKNPQLDQLMFKLDQRLFQYFHDINRLVHVIESSFVYQLRARTHWTVPNPFVLNQDFSNCHLSVCYTDFGKNSYEKWRTNDDSPNDDELSNWKTIGSSLRLDLHSGYHSDSLPRSYVEYCTTHGIDIVSPFWPIGNVKDAGKNLGKIRNLCNRNFQIPDNPLQFAAI